MKVIGNFMVRMVAAAVAVIASLSCTLPGDEPLKTLRYEPSGDRADGTVVLLRGIGGGAERFARHGWIDAARNRGKNWSFLVPDAHFGYYREGTIVTRLRSEVVAAVTADESNEKVWLVGISMGGLGSLFYLLEEPEDVAGVVVIAPYLGSEELVQEILAGGGLDQWNAGEIAEDGWERSFLKKLQAYLRRTDGPPIYLAYGEDDTYLAGQKMLAEALPKERVLTMSGGHRNKVFAALWLEILNRGMITF